MTIIRAKGPESVVRLNLLNVIGNLHSYNLNSMAVLKSLKQRQHPLACQWGQRQLYGVPPLDEELLAIETAKRGRIALS